MSNGQHFGICFLRFYSRKPAAAEESWNALLLLPLTQFASMIVHANSIGRLFEAAHDVVDIRRSRCSADHHFLLLWPRLVRLRLKAARLHWRITKTLRAPTRGARRLFYFIFSDHSSSRHIAIKSSEFAVLFTAYSSPLFLTILFQDGGELERSSLASAVVEAVRQPLPQ